jgi:hypothetical protein
MRIILTYSIEDTLNNFDSYENFERISIGDLMRQRRQENPWAEIIDGLDLLEGSLSQYIGQDVIIGGAMGSIEDYNRIKQILNNLSIIQNIEKVFIWQSDMYDSLTEEEKKSIDTHSRWTGDYTEDILLRQNETNQELQALKNHIEADGVEVVWVE